MFLKALYDFAMRHRLLEEYPLEPRSIHLLIPLDIAGNLRVSHLLPLTHTDDKEKERPGRKYLMPRFVGSNSGGKAFFLAADAIAVLGRDKNTGEPIPANPKTAPRNLKNQAKAFQHFWLQIEEAFTVTQDVRLAALRAFRDKYLVEKGGKIDADLPFLKVQSNKNTGKPECVACTGPEPQQFYPLKDAALAFTKRNSPSWTT